ncbi:hypothetical protein F183_A06920 [Bryobacterales bacterium F-183]|nr:hypothetical protein F183_A06920 [Bryobacterales bacterium F-183]
MSRYVEAVYEEGVFRPLAPISLSEHQKVRLTVEETTEPSPVERPPVPVNPRKEELRWLATNSSPYAGQWVALEGDRLIAHGPKLSDVQAAAAAAGVENPLFSSVPADNGLPFGGW